MQSAKEIVKAIPHLRDWLKGVVPALDVAESVVVVGGSIVEGFGNATSDLDILVVADNFLELQDRSRRVDGPRNAYDLGESFVALSEFDGQRVDIEIRTRTALENVLLGIRLDMESGYYSPFSVAFDWYEFLNDLQIGIPLSDEIAMAKFCAELPWGGIQLSLVNTFIGYQQSQSEDAVGAIKAGDAGTAMYASKEALGRAFDAFIAAHGCLNPKPKWRTRKLARLGLEAELAEYLQLMTDPSADPDALLAAAKRRVRVAQGYITKAQRLLQLESDGAG